MKVKLSQRLSAIAAMIPEGYSLADIGTDHGYLPVHLVMNGTCPYAVVTDIAEHPLESSKQLVGLLALQKKINLRCGDGLKVLSPKEVDIISIAGLGAMSIIRILEQSPPVLASVQKLVLQPMRAAAALRYWLNNHDWVIVDEDIVWEDSNFYEIIGAIHGEEKLTKTEIEVGPVLLRKQHPLLKSFLEDRVQLLQGIACSLENAREGKSRERQQEVKQKINQLEKVIKWLPQ